MGVSESLDLCAEHRAIVVALLEAHLPGTLVWAYGSRVKWTARGHSDLDLVVFPRPDQRDRVATLREAFENSDLPFRVDLLLWDDASMPFRTEIEAVHVVLVERQETPSGWRRLPLSAMVDIRLSSVDKKSNDEEVGIRLCNYTDVYYNGFIRSNMKFMEATATAREITHCKLLSGDVVITKDSEKYDDIGVPALVRDDFCDLVCGYHLAILRSKEISHGPYLFYAVSDQSTQQQFHAYANGVTRFGLRKSDIGCVEVSVPSIFEQRAIARVLGVLDDRIELTQRMNTTLEAMARALFKSWFVDFDPVRAKMEGHDPGLPQKTAEELSDRLVKSELGEIPEGWGVATLGDLCQPPQYGYTASAKNDPVGPRLLRITDINKAEWITWDDVPYCEISSSDFEKYRVAPGDVLIARMADPGHGVLIEDGELAVFASYLIRFRPLDRVFSRFLQYWLRSPGYWQVVAGQFTGTTRMNINAQQLRSLPLVVPSWAIIEAFASHVNALRAAVVAGADEIRSLTQIRDGLLPRLVSGETRLPPTLVERYGETVTTTAA